MFMSEQVTSSFDEYDICHLIETKSQTIHWGNIGVMWIIITLTTHTHILCNLKAIMGSVTFLIQSSPGEGAVRRVVSPGKRKH